MKKIIVTAVMAAALSPLGAIAQERVGDAALGALLGRWPALQSAIRQDPPSPAHGGLDGTADIITGDTRGAENILHA